MSEAVYFPEGPGFFFLRPLSSGSQGSVSLVRSYADGQLYVRKEEFLRHIIDYSNENDIIIWEHSGYNPNAEMIPHSISTHPREYGSAQKLQHIDGVYKSVGWCLLYDHDPSFARYVTYWKYYNEGSLTSAQDRLSPWMEKQFPEYWVCKMLLQMAQTLRQVHEAGMLHGDIWLSNWLVETNRNSFPAMGDNPGAPTDVEVNVVLADFGVSMSRTTESDSRWSSLCQENWEAFENTARDLVKDEPGYSEKLLGILSKISRHSSLVETGGPPAHDWIEELYKHTQTLTAVPWPCPPPDSCEEWFVAPQDLEAVFEPDIEHGMSNDWIPVWVDHFGTVFPLGYYVPRIIWQDDFETMIPVGG